MRRTPYEVALESRVPGARPVYRFDTADGVTSKRSFRTAELLLVESLWEAELGDLLVVEANYGVVGTVLGETAASVHLTESSDRSRQLCVRNAARNGVDVRTSLVADVATLDGSYDTVAYAPKPYTPLSVGEQHLADSLSLLGPNGRLYLAAAERTGLARYEACLRDVAGAVDRVAQRDGYALLEATRPRSFEPPPYLSPRTIQPEIGGTTLSLVTVPGLFSASKLDVGTRLLLETAVVEDGERVLDLCCGYGAVGAYAGRVADCEVWLSDDDRLATTCAECGLDASGVEGTVVTADCVDGVAGRTFDRVLCNPPTHAGSDVLSELFDGVHRVLDSDGALSVVHHRNLDLRPHLGRFDRVDTRRTGNEHVVVRATD